MYFVNNMEEWATVPRDHMQQMLNIQAKEFNKIALESIGKIIDFVDSKKGYLNIGDQLREIYKIEKSEKKEDSSKPTHSHLKIV